MEAKLVRATTAQSVLPLYTHSMKTNTRLAHMTSLQHSQVRVLTLPLIIPINVWRQRLLFLQPVHNMVKTA
jgi:hypothetical protein